MPFFRSLDLLRTIHGLQQYFFLSAFNNCIVHSYVLDYIEFTAGALTVREPMHGGGNESSLLSLTTINFGTDFKVIGWAQNNFSWGFKCCLQIWS